MFNSLTAIIIFLLAAVTMVPLFKRAGLGSILGYLVAGILIGPWGLKLITDVESIFHFSELGVVMLLFIIGLELEPSRLWQMRRLVFGMGALQVFCGSAVLGTFAHLWGLSWIPALLVGFCLSLSSTALVLSSLTEKLQMATPHGQATFGVLLFQDLAAIPVLAVIPLLGQGTGGDHVHSLSLLNVILVLAAVIVGGRLLIRPVFRFITSSRNHEIFVATALLTVMGTAWLMGWVGLSMSLGAFLAGALLADSEYRHELQADIEPFKGLLLGLFFMAVGMSLDGGILMREWQPVLLLIVGFMGIKFLLGLILGRLFLKSPSASLQVGFLLSQGGEFAFVLLGLATAFQLISPLLSAQLVIAVTASLFIAPVLFALSDRLVIKFLQSTESRSFDEIQDEDSPVIIAGVGRFGQMVARILRASKIRFTALEVNADQVDFIRKFGNKLYYGDASRLDLLQAAKADKAKVMVVAVDDVETSLKIVKTVQKHFKNLKIYVRARNRQHVFQLLDLKVDYLIRETFLSSLELGKNVLQGLGVSPTQASETVRIFQKHDENTILSQHAGDIHRDQQKMIDSAKVYNKILENLLEKDEVTVV